MVFIYLRDIEQQENRKNVEVVIKKKKIPYNLETVFIFFIPSKTLTPQFSFSRKIFT